MLALTTYFNDCETRRQNIESFWQGLPVDVSLICAYADSKPILFSKTRSLVGLTRSSYCLMWQKEALLNKLLKETRDLRDEFIAWLDCDVLFDNPIWPHNARVALGTAKIIQLFTWCDNGDTAKSHWRGSPNEEPGKAWAARADVIREIGFFPFNAVGGAAAIMAHSFLTDKPDPVWSDLYTPAHLAMILDYQQKVYRAIRGNFAHIPGTLTHLYHGPLKDRQYRSRHEILKRHNYDPAKDVRINGMGCLEWCSDKPEMHREVAEYFKNRNEDVARTEERSAGLAIEESAKV